jgi:hypothetical protein
MIQFISLINNHVLTAGVKRCFYVAEYGLSNADNPVTHPFTTTLEHENHTPDIILIRIIKSSIYVYTDIHTQQCSMLEGM